MGGRSDSRHEFRRFVEFWLRNIMTFFKLVIFCLALCSDFVLGSSHLGFRSGSEMAAIVRYTDRMVCAVGLALTMSEVPALVMGILNIVQLNNNQGLVSDDWGTDAGTST